MPSTAPLTTAQCFTLIAVISSAPILSGSCTASSPTSSSITFSWSPATPDTGVTYYLVNGTTIIARTSTTATISNLSPGTFYVYSLTANTNGSNSNSSVVSCYGWTGELVCDLLRVSVVRSASRLTQKVCGGTVRLNKPERAVDSNRCESCGLL